MNTKKYLHLWTDAETIEKFRNLANTLNITHHQLLNRALAAYELKASEDRFYDIYKYKAQEMKEDNST